MTTDRGVNAPSFRQLRPMRGKAQVRTSTFPVYDDLETILAMCDRHPDARVRHVLATCAGYAYSDEQTVAMIMTRLGLESNRCRMIAEHVDAMFICSSAFLVQSHDGSVVILCYRGTEPATFINWLTDADIHPEQIPLYARQPTATVPDGGDAAEYLVHGGFYRNVRATRYLVIRALENALAKRSILEDGEPVEKPMEALYLTGHSLGGAMAAMMAVMLATVPEYSPIARVMRGVYTYGQPMIGSKKFAHECELLRLNGEPFLANNVFRYIYDHDVVPHLPPKESGDFSHFGREFLHPNGHRSRVSPVKAAEWIAQRKASTQTNLPGLVIAPVAAITRLIQPLRTLPLPQSLDDHAPQHYIAALTPQGRNSEFGD